MNPNILFKGKCISNGVWATGYPLLWDKPIIMSRHKIDDIDEYLYSYHEVEPDSISIMDDYLPDQKDLRWIIVRVNKDSPEEIVRMLKLYLERNNIIPI